MATRQYASERDGEYLIDPRRIIPFLGMKPQAWQTLQAGYIYLLDINGLQITERNHLDGEDSTFNGASAYIGVLATPEPLHRYHSSTHRIVRGTSRDVDHAYARQYAGFPHPARVQIFYLGVHDIAAESSVWTIWRRR